MNGRQAAIAAIAAAGTIAASPAPALAASGDLPESSSANWSGYVAGGSAAGGSSQFSSVAGNWVEPSADCSSGDGDAAFWVGLGGASEGSGALEQVGTQVNCSSGSATHYAWYELVPAAPVKLDLPLSAGDHVSAHVSVAGSQVTVSLTNQTSGATATKTLQMDNPDASSAEWIAEAPSVCQGADASNTASCTPVPLTNFGTVTFTNAAATANGTTGTISSSDWSAQAVQLSGTSGAQAGYPGMLDSSSSDTGSAGATPSSLSTDGSSFSVAWQSAGSQSVSSSTNPADPGSGYGSGDGYGSGPSDGYAPGDGYDPGAGYGYDPGGGYAPGDGYGPGSVYVPSDGGFYGGSVGY